ncbi:DNA-binding protein [Candidatus Parcubacteria bacterium]|nr:DNA-binding protein [Candidatus Parcubacteria bacterium]
MKLTGLDQSSYIIRLDPGEEITPSIEALCRQYAITNASISGIGSVESPTLAHYRMDKKKYHQERLEGVFEIASLTGNVALFEGKPLVHLHAVVSDEQMRTFGGHLVSGSCSAAVEIILQKFDSKYQKHFDDQIGLKVWDLPDSQ